MLYIACNLSLVERLGKVKYVVTIIKFWVLAGTYLWEDITDLVE